MKKNYEPVELELVLSVNDVIVTSGTEGGITDDPFGGEHNPGGWV